MRLTRIGATLGAGLALAAMFTLAACSDDSAPGKVDLSGTYEVTGVWQGLPSGTPVLTPVSGTATLTSTNYDVDIPGVAASEGVYEAFDNGTFTQDGTTTVPGQDPFETQCSGTYSIVNSILTVDVVCQGTRTVTQFEPLD